MSKEQRQKDTIKVTLIGAVLDFILGVAKVIIGFLFHSHALVVDGIHSFTDLLTDTFIIGVSKFSHADPDDDHPYGHGKYETFATLILGAVLFGTAGALIYETIGNFFSKVVQPKPTWPTIVVAIVSLVSKEAIFQYTKKEGERIKSNMLIANAWHSRSDALSSLAVLVGLIFTIFGHQRADSIAAIVVSIFIAKIGWDFFKQSFLELSDTGLDKDKVEEIMSSILKIDGVKSAHNLRTRWVGTLAFVDVNIEVDSYITVSEGHEIASWVATHLIKNFEEIHDVTVHTDVEDDTADSKKIRLPLRSQVVQELKSCWKDEDILTQLKGLRLHYVDKAILVELLLPIESASESLDKESLELKASSLSWFSGLQVLYL